jgi:hypothetical protein
MFISIYQHAHPQQTQKSLGEGDLPLGVVGVEGVDGGVMLSLSLYKNFSLRLCSFEW